MDAFKVFLLAGLLFIAVVGFFAATWPSHPAVPEFGLVINLAHRKDRLRAFRASNYRSGLPFTVQRFPAVLDSPGQRGALLSHFSALEAAVSQGRPTIILEDDWEWEKPWSYVEARLRAAPPDWDVLLLGRGTYQVPHPSEDAIKSPLWQRVGFWTSAAAYIVRPDYAPVLLDAWWEGLRRWWEEGEPDSPYDLALDVLWGDLQRRGRWYALTGERVGRQAPGYSDIEKRHVRYDD